VTDGFSDVNGRFDMLMRQRSGTERVRLMSEMFDFARTLVLSNLRVTHPTATERELRVLLFERLYGSEIDAAERARIMTRLRSDD